MITNNPLHASIAERFNEYAHAYLDAAECLNEKTIQDGENATWSSSSTVLFNAVHAVELFLKALILKATPGQRSASSSHNIQQLATEFRKLYPLVEWTVPFERKFAQTDDSKEIFAALNLAPEEQKRLIEQMKRAKPFSIENRYPVDLAGNEWETLQGHHPQLFKIELKQIRDDFLRVWSHEE